MSFNLDSTMTQLLPLLQMLLSNGTQKDPVYKSQAGAYALTYDYAPSMDIMTLVQQLIGVTPREIAPAFSFQYDLMRQKERTMEARMQTIGDMQSPMMNALLASTLESFGVNNAHELFVNPLTGQTTFGGKAVNMITKTLLPSLTLPHQQIGEMSNIVYNAMAGLVPPDDESSKNRFGRGVTREKARDIVNQLLDTTYTDESTTQTKGMWKASDMMELTRMSRDFGVLRNTESDDMARKITNFGSIIQQAMGTFNVSTKEEGLKSILDMTGGSVDLTDTSKLRLALDKIKSLSEMTNLSVQVIKQVIEQGQEVSKQMNISAGAGTNIALSSLNQWHNMTTEMKGALPVTQNEAVATMNTFRAQVVSSHHIQEFSKIYGAAKNAGYTDLADEMLKAQMSNKPYNIREYEQEYETRRKAELATKNITDTTEQNMILSREKSIGKVTGQEAITSDNPFIENTFINQVVNTIADTDKQTIQKFNQGEFNKQNKPEDYQKAFTILSSNLYTQLTAKGHKPETASLLSNTYAANYLNQPEILERLKKEEEERVRLSAGIKSAEFDRINEATASHGITKLLSGASLSNVFDDIIYGTTTKQLQQGTAPVKEAIEFQKFGWLTPNFKEKLTYAKSIYGGYVTSQSTFDELSKLDTTSQAQIITSEEENIYKDVADPTIKNLQEKAIRTGRTLTTQRAYELSMQLNKESAASTNQYISALKRISSNDASDNNIIQNQLNKALKEYTPDKDARIKLHFERVKENIKNFKDSDEYKKAKKDLEVDDFKNPAEMFEKLKAAGKDVSKYNDFGYETDTNVILEKFDSFYKIDGKQLYQHEALRNYLIRSGDWKKMSFYQKALDKTGKTEFSSPAQMRTELQKVGVQPSEMSDYGQYLFLSLNELLDLNKQSEAQINTAYEKNLERQAMNKLRGLTDYTFQLKTDDEKLGVIPAEELKNASKYTETIDANELEKVKLLSPFVGFDVALAMTHKGLKSKEELQSLSKAFKEKVSEKESSFNFKRNDKIGEFTRTDAFSVTDNVADAEDLALSTVLFKYFKDEQNLPATLRFAQGKATPEDLTALQTNENVKKALDARTNVAAFKQEDITTFYRQQSFNAVGNIVATSEQKFDLRQSDIMEKFNNAYSWLLDIKNALSGVLKMKRIE